MNVNYDFVVDFARPNKSNTLIISENDSKSRTLHFVLLANKQPLDMTDVTSAVITAMKPDKTTLAADVTILTDDKDVKLNELEYVMDPQLAQVPGTMVATITLNAGEKKLTSFEFYIEIRNMLYNVDDYISDETKQGFTDLLNRSMAALEKMESYVGKDSLPNPYELVIDMDENKYHYDGREEVEVNLDKVAFWQPDPDIQEEIADESAAAIAIEAARMAEAAKVTAEAAVAGIGASVINAEAYATQARLDKEGADASANAAQTSASSAQESASIAQAAAGVFVPTEVEQIKTDGDLIARISVNGEATDIYASFGASDIPTKLSELEDDATHRLVTDEEKAGWDSKADVSALDAKADVSALDAKADVSALATKADKTQLSNRNLLDNAWFTVNQRRQSRYSGNMYSVDRWKVANSAIVVNNGYITFSSATTWGNIYQLLNYSSEYADKTFTMSIEISADSQVSDLLFAMQYMENGVTEKTIKQSTVSVTSDRQIVTMEFTMPSLTVNDLLKFRIGNIHGLNEEIKIYRAKLELGSISTLANDVAPNYAEELLRCQRYFVRYRGNTNNHAFAIGHPTSAGALRIPIWLPTSMRTNSPMVIFGGILKASLLGSAEAFNCTGLSRVDMCNNVIVLETSGSFQTEKSYITILADGNTYIDISADF